MKYRFLLKVFIFILLIINILIIQNAFAMDDALYDKTMPQDFIKGMTYHIDNKLPIGYLKQKISADLADMKEHFGVNTINVYGLECLDDGNGSDTIKNHLFEELKNLVLKQDMLS